VTNPINDPLVGRTVAQYDILARVGGGGMGVVYRARDRKLGRVVALKFLPQQWSHDETAKQRFVREAQAASATDHPNICTIHDIETADDGQLFIVMTYYEGPTLKQRLEAGALPIEEALDIATQIADGLAKAHAQGVIHRDIKPGNLLLTEHGVRILDFGLATFADALKLTTQNATLGTAAYMSPEQVRGQASDARTDVWAAGVVLYEMLTGHVPFQGSHAEAIGHAVRNEAPAPLRSGRPDVSEDVERLVFRALHKETSVRYQSGRELARALREVRGVSVPLDLRTERVVTPQVVTPPTPPKRWWKPVVATMTLVLLAAAPVVWWFRPVERVPVAIAPIANQTGDTSLQPYLLALTQALERGLAESRFIRVVPHEQLRQMISRFTVDGVEPSSLEAIQSISAHSGAKVVIVPTLIYENGAMRVRARFVNPATATAQGPPLETAPTSSLLTRDAASELVEALTAPIDEYFRGGRWLAATGRVSPKRFRTLDAAKAFEEGISAFAEFEYSAAGTAFQTAAREDPAHPLPAAWLSRVARALGDRDGATKAGAQAMTLVSNATSMTDRLFTEAVAAESRGDRTTATARYRELVSTFPDEPAWLIELAALLDRQGDTDAAIETNHLALQLDARLARPHLQLCRLYNSTRANDAGLAKKHGEQARDAYATLGAAGGEAQALLCLVDILRLGDASQRAEARRNADRALKIYERLGWPFNLARSYHYAAMAVSKDNASEAAALWEKALAGARRVGYGALEAGALSNLGVTYLDLGNRGRALDYYRQSFELHEKQLDARGAAYSRANAGALMVHLGTDPDQGMRYLETALKVVIDLEDANFEMFCRQGLAEYYRHTGQFALADREINRAMDLARRHGFADDMPSLLLDRARLHVANGEYEDGRADFDRAINSDAGPETEMRIGLGLVQVLLGDFDAARQLLDRAERDVRAEKRGNLEPELRMALGMLAYESGRLPEARREFGRAAALGQDEVPDANIIEANAYAGFIDAQDGRATRGPSAMETCAERARQMRRVSLEAKCRVFLARTSLRQQRPDEAARVLADVKADSLGPELRAQVHYWRAKASIARGDLQAARSDDAIARRLLDALRESVPSSSRERFATRTDIRVMLQ
jgi:serine/threonine protein kinase/tetratricopeptide (TPR) repeat protein